MTLSRHLVVSLVALATAGLAAGCGGDGSGGNDGDVMRATLTGDGCRYQGDTTPVPGTLTVEVRNETSGLADFDLMQLPEGTDLKEIEGWFNKARQKYQQTGNVRIHPITWVSSTLVAPHATSELPANASSGRLAVLCAPASSIFSDAENSPPFPSRVIAAAELDVRPKG